MKKRLGPSDRLYPMPAVLICGGTMDDADACTVAWLGICATNPPRIAVALRGSRHTLERIRATGTFTVNTAHSADAAIVPFYISTDRAWHFRSWDSFFIPKPFAKVTLSFGNLIKFSPTESQTTFENQRLDLERIMRPRIRARA